VSTVLGPVQREVLSAGLLLLRHVRVQPWPGLLFKLPLLRRCANLLRLRVLRSSFDLLWEPHVLSSEYGLLQRPMLLQSPRDLLRRRVLPGRLSLLRRQVRKGAAVT